MVKTKFCGMTNEDDCKKAIDLSVDFVGFVFYEKSPRHVSPSKVGQIVEKLGGRIGTVGVFVEESDAQIAAIMDHCGLDYAQVYRRTTIPRQIRAIRVGDRLPDIPFDDEGLILFDSLSEGYGGSGKSFDVQLLQGFEALDRTFVAGGVSIANVGAILRLKPFGIDLVSSIEVCKGKKDHRKMEEFMKTVRSFHQ
jgi:phosphoribosylanthranilate isomerase